jgi:hypothetical protein
MQTAKSRAPAVSPLHCWRTAAPKAVAIGLTAQLLFGSTCADAGIAANSTSYPSKGSSADVVITDRNDVLVSITPQSDEQTPGVQVFRPSMGFRNPCPGGKSLITFNTPGVKQVQGLQILPDTLLQLRRQSIGAAVEAQGVNFFRALDLNTCTIDSEKNVPQAPATASAPNAPGTFLLAVTPGSPTFFTPEFAFVANEYGAFPATAPSFQLPGTIGVVRVRRDIYGRFTQGTGLIRDNPYLYVPGAQTIPGITMSHNGKYLYVVDEGAQPDQTCTTRLGSGPCNNPTNIQPASAAGRVSEKCKNEFGWTDGNWPNGVLSIFDVRQAAMGKGQAALLITVAAGCSPVRVVESRDGEKIWVAARGGDPNDPASGQIYAFDVSKLLSNSESTVNAAMIGVWPSGGTQPVGLALFNHEQYLAVANSNRYSRGETGQTNVAILDVRHPSTPPVVCKSKSIFDFPRGIAVAKDDATLLVANYGCKPNPSNDPPISCVPPTSGLAPTIVGGSLQVIRTSRSFQSSCQ